MAMDITTMSIKASHLAPKKLGGKTLLMVYIFFSKNIQNFTKKFHFVFYLILV